MTSDVLAERAEALSFRQLRLFEAIGDLKSVRRASEECGVSQPAVTQALAKLEEHVGALLVDRRSKGSYLNPIGEGFHARVKRFFAQVETAIVESGAAATAFSARPVVNRLTRSQIRTLIEAIEYGSFEAAAEAIGISKSSVQRGARDLESNLHVSLFYRTAAGILVSPVGIRFGRRMKLAFQEVEWGIDEIAARQGGHRRQMVIGAMPFGGSVLLASVLDEFLRSHPQADVRIMSDGAAAMTRSLLAGDADLVIGLLPQDLDAEMVAEPLSRTPYAVVARRGHPLAAKGRLTIDDLVACTWVVGEIGSSRRRCFDALFADRAGPQAQIATCATPVIRQLLERSDRLTLMTSYELQYADGRLGALSTPPIQPVPSLGIMTRSGFLPTPLHEHFMALVRAHVASQPTPLRRVV